MAKSIKKQLKGIGAVIAVVGGALVLLLNSPTGGPDIEIVVPAHLQEIVAIYSEVDTTKAEALDKICYLVTETPGHKPSDDLRTAGLYWKKIVETEQARDELITAGYLVSVDSGGRKFEAVAPTDKTLEDCTALRSFLESNKPLPQPLPISSTSTL